MYQKRANPMASGRGWLSRAVLGLFGGIAGPLAYFRDASTCEDMDIAFIRYDQITRLTVSLHHPKSGRLGFDLAKSRDASNV